MPTMCAGFQRRLAAFTPDAARTSRELKQFLYAKVYTAPDLSQDRARSMQRIGELFQFFLDHPDRLPEAYRAQAGQRAAASRGLRLYCGHDRCFFGRVYSALA